MSYVPGQPARIEDVNRGTFVALLAMPVGVIVWVLIWSIGFVASIVPFGIALLAMFLYTVGSGGVLSRTGAIRVTVITLVTVAIAIFAGIVSDVALAVAKFTDISPVEALSTPEFSELLTTYLAEGDWGFSVLIAIVFAILGCFSVLRNAFRSTTAAGVTGGMEQQAWPQQQQPWPQQQAWPQHPEQPSWEQGLAAPPAAPQLPAQQPPAQPPWVQQQPQFPWQQPQQPQQPAQQQPPAQPQPPWVQQPPQSPPPWQQPPR